VWTFTTTEELGMRLISLKDSRITDNTEVFYPDSVEHSVYLHDRYWAYADPILPRANLIQFGHLDCLYIDIGFVGPQSYTETQTAKLGEATKVAMFTCGDEMELVALTSEDEIVQVLVRGSFRKEDELDQFEHVVLHTRRVAEWEDIWIPLQPRQPEDWDSAVAFDHIGRDSMTLAFEIDDRYAGEPQLPTRVLQTGEGTLCDMRSNWSFTLSIVQRVGDKGEVANIGSQVFKHPSGVWKKPLLSRLFDSASKVLGEPDAGMNAGREDNRVRARRSERKRRRRVANPSLAAMRRRRKSRKC
jgi:hypothetical protein